MGGAEGSGSSVNVAPDAGVILASTGKDAGRVQWQRHCPDRGRCMAASRGRRFGWNVCGRPTSRLYTPAPMAAPPTAEQIREVNTRYHDVAAAEYDAKWGIDFGEVGRAQVLGKVRKLLGRHPGPFDHSLEIGSGTGYFTLNLMQAGVIENATCTDISPGMLTTLAANAGRLELEVTPAVADAEALPFADESFDLVLGHAVLHHLPDLQQAFAEFARVLAPGGSVLFAGEPSR